MRARSGGGRDGARADCHPERRARSARHFVILSGGREAPGVEGPHRTHTPAAAKAFPGWDARGSSDRPRRLGRKALPACGKAALKGRWAGMPIDPAAHGSPTCGFALRNLHKSPCPYGLGARSCLRLAWGLLPDSGLRRLVQVSRGWSRAGRATDLRAPAGKTGRASSLPTRAEKLSAASPLALSRACDPLKSGGQGSMGRCAHRPSCLWFVHLRVRLTKPPQIAMSSRAGPSPGPQRACELRARAGLRRSVQVSCGWPRAGRAIDLRAHVLRSASRRRAARRPRAAPKMVTKHV